MFGGGGGEGHKEAWVLLGSSMACLLAGRPHVTLSLVGITPFPPKLLGSQAGCTVGARGGCGPWPRAWQLQRQACCWGGSALLPGAPHIFAPLTPHSGLLKSLGAQSWTCAHSQVACSPKALPGPLPPAFLGARVASQIKASHSWSGAYRGCHSPSSELLLPVGAVPGCPQSQPGRVSPFSCHFCYAGFGCVMSSLLASPGLAVSGSSPPKPGAGCLWVPQASVQVFSSLPDLLQTWQSLHVSVNIHISPWQVTRTSPRGSKKTIQSF